jgi:outer membrane protein OmpA-like peptidoglycan-associated protein
VLSSAHRSLALVLALGTALGSLACYKHAQRGLVIGAVGGAAVGGVIGKATGSTAKGAIIGAAVGGAAGAIIGDQMDRRAAKMKREIPGAKIERVGEGILVTFESGLIFDFDSDALRPTTRTNLDALARNLQEDPKTNLLIVGHTDATGTEAYNKDLSVRRADAAARYIIDRGVARTRIGTGGLGEEEPVATNETDAGRQQNRRIEVAIYASEQLREEARAKAGT